MKYIPKFWVQGRTGSIQGLIATVITLAMLAFTAGSARAAHGITQLEYIQWLVQATGETSQFTGTSTAADYQQWAQGKGLLPNGGWRLTARLTKPVLAQTLVQLLNLSTSDKDGNDFARVLLREGINLPTADDIDRGSLVNFLSTPSIPIPNPGSPAKGNNGVGNGEDPPPPGFLNPNNPHFG